MTEWSEYTFHVNLNFDSCVWPRHWPHGPKFCTPHSASQLWTFVPSYIDIPLCMSGKRFKWPLSVTKTFDIETWFMRDTASHSGEHFYEVSLKFFHAYRRYAPGKNWTPPVRCPPSRPFARGRGGGVIIRPVILNSLFSDSRIRN
jgi:hypothetical protein